MEEPTLVTTIFNGSTLELSCKAESAPEVDVNYRWYKCDKEGGVEGAREICNSSKMFVSEVTHLHQGYYKCVISPEVSSRVACVKVIIPRDIKFTVQPVLDQSLKVGEKLALNCEAECADHYQWYHNGKPLINANSSQLIIPQVGKEDIGFYYCEARTRYSVEGIASEVIKLSELSLLYYYVLCVCFTLLYNHKRGISMEIS